MFLDCFKRWRRNRKQAVVKPAPQSPTISQDSTIDSIDDAAIVPAKGFLGGPIELPTYESKPGPRFKPQAFSHQHAPQYARLTTRDILETMSKGARLARCVLFETARLQRPFISAGALRLSQGARVLDTELIDLSKVLGKGSELIGRPRKLEDRKKQDLILEGQPFQKALQTAKKSLLELEKTFNDQVLGELKNGMQSKESVDHGQLVGKVGNTKNGLRKVYEEITIAYSAEERRREGRGGWQR